MYAGGRISVKPQRRPSTRPLTVGMTSASVAIVQNPPLARAGFSRHKTQSGVGAKVSIEGTGPRVLDRGWLAAAVSLANVPTLACVLVHLTGERRWIEGRYVPTRVRGLDDNDSGGLAEDVQNEIRHAALEALTAWFAGRAPVLSNPSD